MNQEEIYTKLKPAIIEGLNFISKIEEEFFSYNLMDYYDDYPALTYRNNGYPYFTKSRFVKKKYFRILDKDNFCVDSKNWKEFKEFILNHNEYCKFYLLGKYSEQESEVSQTNRGNFFSEYTLKKLIDRYIHIYSTKEFVDSKFKTLFYEWYNYFTLSDLQIEIIVPILMVTFDFETIEINDFIVIERMNDIFQMSRNTKTSTNSSPHQEVISSATHALVLKNFSFKNENYKNSSELNETSIYQNIIFEYIEKIFACLRIQTGIDTGYSQIIAKPINWASSYSADLLPLAIATTKGYPEYFENEYWHYLPDTITLEKIEIENIKRYLEPLKRNIQIAINRLNNAFLRRHIDDSILDITIALEALFIDTNENTEVTHKLSTRVAILCKLFPLDSFTSFQIFKACKSIYSFRSAIIHSKEEKVLDKNRIIKSSNITEITSVEAGIKILSHSIQILLMNPKFQNIEEIDKIIFDDTTKIS
jgi:hypothetical protein